MLAMSQGARKATAAPFAYQFPQTIDAVFILDTRPNRFNH